MNQPSVNETEKQPSQMLFSGTPTFLFTDVEGSTHLWEQYPEQMRGVMTRHDELIESAVVEQNGMIVRPRGEGDSRFAVFSCASDALRAAIAIQRLLFAEPWTIPPLRVRIGLHSGEADLREGDYYGTTVNRCARMRNAAHGGQVIMSQATYYLVQDEMPSDVSLHDLGEYQLKDFDRSEHIYQAVVSDLPAEFPPLKTPFQIHDNLPVALTSFVGRKRELRELERLFWQSRLLTIAGPGGAGKTRLAIKAAQNVRGFFPDGIWFIDLAPLTKVALLNQYVMKQLEVREEAGYPPDQTLLDSLGSKTILLVLDNCEHLLPAVAHLAETMLRYAPRLRIIATSREKLGVSGEIIWRIPPLSTPEAKGEIPLENWMKYEAVKLFQDRAASVKPDFMITPKNAATVAQICVRLDGIPLAIELAAARIRVLSVEEIETRLNDRFRLLVGSSTALPRQQTLRALIDWSYDLLSEKERLILRRLSVFSGGWTLAAAEQVCSDHRVEAHEMLDILTSLIDKSFVIGEAQNGHERYGFLETILKFSQERLLESQEADQFKQKHARYFLKLARSSYGKLWGPEQADRLNLLDEDRDNLYAALEWASQPGGDKKVLLQMAGTLWRYWEIRGYLTEGRSWLESALEASSEASEYWRANDLSGAGHLARQQGDYARAKELHEESLSLFRAIDCKMGSARQLNALGEIAHFQGNYAQAVDLHEESLSIRYEIGDKEGVAVSLRQLGGIARDRGQYAYAKKLLEESLGLVRELGDKLLIALSLNDLGLVAYHLCDYEQAITLFEESISLQRDLNDKLGISNSVKNLGNVAKDQGDFKQAEQLFQKSLALKQDLGDKRGISQVIGALAEVAFWQGKYPLAAELAGQCLRQSQELGIKRGVLISLTLLGFIALYQGDYEQAASYAEEILSMSLDMDAPRATGYAKVLMALGRYADENLSEAMKTLQEALVIFMQIADLRSITLTYVNLARVAYRQGNHQAAMHFLEDSKSISKDLNSRWNLAFVLEIMALLNRSEGNYEQALEQFQESLRLAVEQENQQGIANCIGGLAGLAVLANQPAQAVRLFAAAAALRKTMGAKMSSNDRVEYEKYLTMVHERMDHATFESEWSEGFTMTTEQVVEGLSAWSGTFTTSGVPNRSNTPSPEGSPARSIELMHA